MRNFQGIIFIRVQKYREILKSYTYEFSLSALKLIHSYLKNRKERTKIDSTFCSWKEILFGVPHGPILRPLLFNILLRNLRFSVKEADFASYTDDNMPYVTGYRTEDVLNVNSFENDSIKQFKWFTDNQMKAIKDKLYFLISDIENITINVDGNTIATCNCEKSLSVNVDFKLKFN